VYSLTGSDVALIRLLIMAAEAGEFALTGHDVALTYTPGIIAVEPVLTNLSQITRAAVVPTNIIAAVSLGAVITRDSEARSDVTTDPTNAPKITSDRVFSITH
jgi:hypothetical protein